MAENPGYAYWHDKVAKGEEAAPKPEHTPIAVEKPKEVALPEASIMDFSFLDDDDVVKIYIKREGDLAGIVDKDIELKVERQKYNPVCSLDFRARGVQKLHVLHAEELCHMVDPEQCKVRVSNKNNKIIITLRKAENIGWEGLRAKMSLPYRRGGGG